MSRSSIVAGATAGIVLAGILLVVAAAARANVNPRAGFVKRGQELKFRIELTSPKLDVRIDSRKSCNASTGRPQYTATFQAVWGNYGPVPLPKPVERPVVGGKLSFRYIVPRSARPGGDFVVNLTVFANCGAQSAYSAVAQWGRYRVRGKGTAPAPTPIPAVRSGKDCGVVMVAGERFHVVVHAAAGCDIEQDVAAGTVAGWTCRSPQVPQPAEKIWLCQGTAGNWAVAVPASSQAPSSCPRVLDDLKGTQQTYAWAIWRSNVDCRFARNQSLTLVRATIDHPPQTGTSNFWWRCVWFSRESVLAIAACQKREPVGGRWFVIHPMT